MTPEPPAPARDDEFVEYRVLGGQRLRLRKHPTDFSVIAPLATRGATCSWRTTGGLGQVAGCNRADHGKPFEPIPGAPNYTRTFGGTSGAAPIVTGIAAHMLSVNPDL